jgi:hypothetical protein
MAGKADAEVRRITVRNPQQVIEAVTANIPTQKFMVFALAEACPTFEYFKGACAEIGRGLGPLDIQNADGDEIVEVYNRKKGSIADGVRYHQTRDGGDIHTDSVNRRNSTLYLLLGCAAPAALGGENILVRADRVLSVLERYPDVEATLREEFWFEGRGMNATSALFRMPVLEGTRAAPQFHYLRPYIENAMKRGGTPVTASQSYAFDVLDSILEDSANQHRLHLAKGDLLVTSDAEVLHGRTSFVDGEVANSWFDHRRMLRLWVV